MIKRIPNRRLGSGGRSLCTLSMLLLAVPPSRAEPKKVPPLAVIVNAKSKVQQLSLAELRAIFTRTIRQWDGRRVVPFNWPAHHPVRVLFDRKVFHKNPEEVATFWINQRIRGRGRPPRSHGSPRIVLSFVAHERDAISYVPRGLVTHKVKVIKIDGLAPGEKGYPLRAP